MAVVGLDEQRGLALCEDAEGARHTVEIALVEPLAANRMVLVHAGVAIASLPRNDGPPDGSISVQRSAELVAISAAPAAAGGAS